MKAAADGGQQDWLLRHVPISVLTRVDANLAMVENFRCTNGFT
ncbi:MAG TPA: hypothetical protein VKE70_18275 [Candidatus Solibacter sp.]|nr:hypothetical protein [Candidatus Solibacter sp.]